MWIKNLLMWIKSPFGRRRKDPERAWHLAVFEQSLKKLSDAELLEAYYRHPHGRREELRIFEKQVRSRGLSQGFGGSSSW